MSVAHVGLACQGLDLALPAGVQNGVVTRDGGDVSKAAADGRRLAVS